jgi:two-component sensor histidine kinase
VLLIWGKPLDLAAQNGNSAPAVRKNFEFYFDTGEAYLKTKEYLVAESYFDSARNMAVIQNDETKLGLCYLRLGTVKKIIGDLDLSMEYFTLAKDIFEKAKKYELLATSHVELAELLRKVRKYSIAVGHIAAAKEVYKTQHLTDTLLLIKIYNRSAAINQEYNPDIRNSISDSYEAIALAKAIGEETYIAVSLNELGFTYKNLGKEEISDSCFLEAERIWIETGHFEEALFVMNNRAMLYKHNLYKVDQIIPLYKAITRIADSLNIDLAVNDAYNYLYEDCLKAGDSAMALHYVLKAHEIDFRNAEILFDYNLHNLASKYGYDKIRNEFEIVKSKLNESSNQLEIERSEGRILILSLALLILLISIITWLLFKIRKSNKILVEKNTEKDSLIQEIHHRVKNNLQFVSSLLNMQVKSAQNIEEIVPLTEASRRISSMALVHEMLYNQADQKGISTKYYLEELIENLYSVVKSDNQKIEFEMEIEDVLLNISDTISIGMITSELISNSMKHAFQETDSPTVFLTLKKSSDGTIRYAIRDNGKGFDKKETRENRLGLRLVDIFSRQLKGSYSISGNDGFRYEMTFKKK